MAGWAARLACAPLLVLLAAADTPAMDPDNPTCPASPNWSDKRTMEITPVDLGGTKVLLAEGAIDRDLPDRLRKALDDNPDALEIWLRSPGGNARAGNEAGRVLRDSKRLIITRVPRGWACFSACNFVFMGGRARIVEPGGVFMVHMFTVTGQREAIEMTLDEGTDSAIELIGDIEQESALLATEDNDFLIRMGVSRRLLTEVMYRQKAVAGTGEDKSTRRCLTPEEALEYNVANVSE
jgi:hypothetical protein